jgi:hypothetical protein
MNRQYSSQMTLSINPLWRRTNPTSGQSQENYAVPITLLVDKELIPSKFFTVFNLIYGPSFQRLNPHWEHDDSFTIIAGGTENNIPWARIGPKRLSRRIGGRTDGARAGGRRSGSMGIAPIGSWSGAIVCNLHVPAAAFRHANPKFDNGLVLGYV